MDAVKDRLNTTTTKTTKGMEKYISYSLLVHGILIALFFVSTLFSDRTLSIEGDNSIKAIMIDISQMAAPEQSLVEDSQAIEGVEEPTLEDIIKDPEPIVDEAEVVDNAEPIIEPKEVVEDKVAPVIEKPKIKPPVKPVVQKASQQQVRQEVATNTLADKAVAPSISDNRQFSAVPSPISRNQPEYPRRALDMRIEGYVIVLYDVNSNGKIENIRIIESKPTNIFNRSVTSAMKLWKYQPIEAKNMQIKIIFNRNKSIAMENT